MLHRNSRCFFAIPDGEKTPYGIPGKIEQGNIKISKKFCNGVRKVLKGGDFDQLLRKGLLKNTIPSDGFHFALIFDDEDGSQEISFQMIALLPDEYQDLYANWLDIIANPPQIPTNTLGEVSSINTAEIPSLYRNSIHDFRAFFPMSQEDSTERVEVRKKQYHNVSDALILEERFYL